MAHKRIDTQSEEGQAYEQLLKVCLSFGSEHDSKKFDVLKSNVAHLSEDLYKQVEAFQQQIAKLPLSAFVIHWADTILEDASSGLFALEAMSSLVEASLLPLCSLEEFSRLDSSFIPEKIRCNIGWPLSHIEKVVHVYTIFVSWLSKETFSYISEAKDFDRLATQKRQIPFETYIKILSCLDLREQILAKMFYLGGNRGLEEVLSVKIEDIDFKKARIHLSEIVPYPRHLFDDIEEYIQGCKKGFLFLGKEGERISHTTPFRALKKVISNLGLDPEFTFRDLTENI
jgi:hypothetical protein